MLWVSSNADDERVEMKRHTQGEGGRANAPQLGEGTREVSWIWRMPALGNKAERSKRGRGKEDAAAVAINGTLWFEWAKSRARLERWQEEETIVEEEMKQTIAYLEWQGNLWNERQRNEGTANSSEEENALRLGQNAYASKQQARLQNMAKYLAGQWMPIIENEEERKEWEGKYGTAAMIGKGKGREMDVQSDWEDIETDDDDDNDDDREVIRTLW